MAEYARDQKDILVSRLREEPKRLIIVTGPRQAGKTTMVSQALREFHGRIVFADGPVDSSADRRFVDPLGLAVADRFSAFDDPVVESITNPLFPAAGNARTEHQRRFLPDRDEQWLIREWTNSRRKLAESDSGYVLAVDEVQKIPNWSETVKGLWDEDRHNNLPLHVILLGSAPLLMQSGMSESLAGRFETIHLNHWSYMEMSALADTDLAQYVYFGGYPGAASYINNETRWRDYIHNSLIKPNIERDILAMERVDKPALLKTLFELSAQYSGQILSYTKLQGNLHDAGNTTTLARYLVLLESAGLIAGLPKYAGSVLRRRSSSPKLIVLNTALMSALSDYSFGEAFADRTFWGRIVESAVGAHLFNTSPTGCKLYYWREQNSEVDFVLRRGQRLAAFEVKSGSRSAGDTGFLAFQRRFNTNVRQISVGGDGVPLAEFLATPASYWFDGQ